jgi:hypothetical protein
MSQPLAPRSLLRRFRPALLLVGLSLTGLMAASECGDGGAGSCKACRDDCERNGIPASQCNCQGCKE